MTFSDNWKSPCRLCGCNGPGFYQPITHPCVTLGSELDAVYSELDRIRWELKRSEALREAFRAENNRSAEGYMNMRAVCEKLTGALEPFGKGAWCVCLQEAKCLRCKANAALAAAREVLG